MKTFWFDLETSGLDPARHGIISLAYQVEIDGHTATSGSLFSNCRGKEIEDSALKVNGYTREQIEKFLHPPAMYEELADLFSRFVDKFDRDDKFYVGGYNVASFDMPFLRQLWKDNGDAYFGSWFYYGAIDPGALLPVLRYAGVELPYMPSSKLTDVARALGAPAALLDHAHDSQADLTLTRFVTARLVGLIHPVATR